jgi:hypothetical protein
MVNQVSRGARTNDHQSNRSHLRHRSAPKASLPRPDGRRQKRIAIGTPTDPTVFSVVQMSDFAAAMTRGIGVAASSPDRSCRLDAQPYIIVTGDHNSSAFNKPDIILTAPRVH